MTTLDIPALRLYNLGISHGQFERPEDVVSWLGAVQAQDYAGSKWALGQRMKSATDEVVEQAFNEGRILRTHLLRPTWHYVTPADIRWLLMLTGPRVQQANGSMVRKLGLDEQIFKRSNALLVKTLQGGKHMTRDELRDVLIKSGVTNEDLLRTTYLIMQAELEGILCSGPRRGKQFTYALLEERAPAAKPLTREEALTELSRRYFLSRGPATVADFAKWSGLTLAECRQGLEAVKHLLQREQVNGQEVWFVEHEAPEKSKSPTVHLLSIYDEYISSYKDRSAIGKSEVAAKLVAMGNDLQFLIVLNGQVSGTWKRSLKKREVLIQANLFAPFSRTEQMALAETAEKYGVFLELPAVLTQNESTLKRK